MHEKIAHGLRMHRDKIVREALRWAPLDHLMVEAHKLLDKIDK